jgi:acyl-CoA thioesterase FadM
MRGARLIFEYSVKVDDTEITTGSTILVFVGKEDKRPIQPPADFTELLLPYQIN